MSLQRLQSGRLRALLTAAGMVAGLFASAGSASATAIQFNGSTTGCFTTNGGSCTPSLLSTPVTTGDPLSFTGVTSFGVAPYPDLDSSIPNDEQTVTLGSFSVAGTGNVQGPDAGNAYDRDFVLRVTFSLPIILTPTGGVQNYTADVAGKISGAGQNISINFNNTEQTYTFADGSFKFYVADPAELTISSRTTSITGVLRGLTLNTQNGGGSAPAAPAPVPEPGTLVLLGTGMLAAASRARRKKT